MALPMFLLALLQPVLAIAGAGGGLHVLGAVAILALASVLTFRAWRGDRAPAATEAAEAADPVTTRPGSPG
jgi:hypothetical protein